MLRTPPFGNQLSIPKLSRPNDLQKTTEDLPTFFTLPHGAVACYICHIEIRKELFSKLDVHVIQPTAKTDRVNYYCPKCWIGALEKIPHVSSLRTSVTEEALQTKQILEENIKAQEATISELTQEVQKMKQSLLEKDELITVLTTKLQNELFSDKSGLNDLMTVLTSLSEEQNSLFKSKNLDSETIKLSLTKIFQDKLNESLKLLSIPLQQTCDFGAQKNEEKIQQYQDLEKTFHSLLETSTFEESEISDTLSPTKIKIEREQKKIDKWKELKVTISNILKTTAELNEDNVKDNHKK